MKETEAEISGDPYGILKLLDNRLGKDGNVVDSKDVVCLLELMEEAKMLVDRCMFVNILRATKNKNILLKFMEEGGWDTLYKWLQEARLEVNKPLIIELLKLYRHLPITVTLLKQNNCAKDVRQLNKSDDESIEKLSKSIITLWVMVVKEKSSDPAKLPDKTKSLSSSSSSSKSSSSSNSKELQQSKPVSSSKHHSSSSTHTSSNTKHSSDAVHKHSSEKPSSDSVSNKSSNSTTSNSVTSPSSLSSQSLHRPKTVKTLTSTMRSTGLELDTPPPSRKKDSSSSGSKNNSNSSSLGKKLPPLSLIEKKPSGSSTTSSSTNHASSSSPTEQKGKIKIIPARPKAPEIYESSGFIDAIQTTDYGAIRRKRKNSMSSARPTATTTTTPATTSADVKDVAVPTQFYRDTLLDNAKSDGEVKDKVSVETSEANTAGSTGDNRVEIKEENEKKSEEAEESSEPAAKKKKVKKVTWAEESKLCSISYFILDETERVNVNKVGNFADSRKHELEKEREMMQSVKRLHTDSMQAKHEWRKPRLITGLVNTVSVVCSSREKQIQMEREQSVLQVLYFSKSMIPDSAAEPEAEFVEYTEPKIIPLTDEMGGTSGDASFTEYTSPSDTTPQYNNNNGGPSVASPTSPIGSGPVMMNGPRLDGPNMGPNMGGPNMGGPMGGPNMGGPTMGGPNLGPNMGGPNVCGSMGGPMGGPNMDPMMFGPGMSPPMGPNNFPMNLPLMDGRPPMGPDGMPMHPMMHPNQRPPLMRPGGPPFHPNFMPNHGINRTPYGGPLNDIGGRHGPNDMGGRRGPPNDIGGRRGPPNDMRDRRGPAIDRRDMHSSGGNQRNKKSRDSQVCQHFLAGHCRYGDSCHLLHQSSRRISPPH